MTPGFSRWKCLFTVLFLITVVIFAASSMEMDSFQENPFMAPEQRDRMALLEMKDQANRLIPDPPHAVRRNGPSRLSYFDQGLPISIGDLTTFNAELLRPVLDQLVRTTYFKYYKVDLDAQCPYWVMNRMCTSGGGCTVCECDENEIPLPWRVESTNQITKHRRDELPFNLDNGDNRHIWSDAEKEQDMHTSTYVNLTENPESNTGYQGEEPRRIWDAIYNENCFAMIGKSNVQDMCLQDRMMYRLISGLHGSISAHVFSNWKRGPQNEWISNQHLWNMLFTPSTVNVDDPSEITEAMIASDARIIDRVNNMMFTLELLLDSVSILREVTFTTKSQQSRDGVDNAFIIDTGSEEDDLTTVSLLNQLVQLADHRFRAYTSSEDKLEQLVDSYTAMRSATKSNGDSAKRVVGHNGNDGNDDDGQEHQDDDIFFSPLHNVLTTLEPNHVNNMRLLFHNVSVIMNCVGCEKCRIWSKLNILGITTSLKINSEPNPRRRLEKILSLKRNELIALINTLNSLSQSVYYVSSMSYLNHTRDVVTAMNAGNLRARGGGDHIDHGDGDLSKQQPKPIRGGVAVMMVVMTIGIIALVVYRTTTASSIAGGIMGGKQPLSSPDSPSSSSPSPQSKDGKNTGSKHLQKTQKSD